MPASVCVLGTVQGDVDTVPYHTQRLLKSTEVAANFSARSFPDRRDHLSVRADYSSPSTKHRRDARARQLGATLPRYLPDIEDHENDLVGAFRETVGDVR
jgi:hypothetical protein